MNRNFKDELDRLIHLIRKNEVIFFCGAGISFNSGIPTVIQLVRNILTRFEVPEEEINIVFNSKLPFEAIISNLLSKADITSAAELFKIFAVGKPNFNHHLIAELIKRRYLTNVITTNFDCHIEDAFYANIIDRHEHLRQIAATRDQWYKGPQILKEHLDKNIYYEDNGFSEINWNSETSNIVKIHGTVSHFPSVIATVELVASMRIGSSRRKVIRNIFSEGEHKAVFVIGYSFSDYFDIVPEIASCSETKEMFVIDHFSGKEEAEDIIKKIGNNPLYNYRGTRFIGDTNNIMQYIWNELIGDPLPNLPNKADTTAADTILNQWFKIFEKNTCSKYLFLGNMFTDISHPDIAEKYVRTGLDKARKSKSNVDEGQLLVALCNVQRHHGNYTGAAENAENAIKIARKLKSYEGELQCLGTLGFCHRNFGDPARALEYHRRALQLARKIKDKAEIATALSGIALAYFDLEKYENAIQYNMEAYELTEETGQVQEKGNIAGNIGLSYKALNNAPEAVKWFLKAIDLAEKTGDYKLKLNTSISLALLTHSDLAHKILKEAENIAINIKSKLWEGRVKVAKGVLYHTANDPNGKKIIDEGFYLLESALLPDSAELLKVKSEIEKLFPKA